jgi:hypothetical protein
MQGFLGLSPVPGNVLKGRMDGIFTVGFCASVSWVVASEGRRIGMHLLASGAPREENDAPVANTFILFPVLIPIDFSWLNCAI